MFNRKYRIVRDRFAGYEVQFRFWWLPFIWFQANGCNTHGSVESARAFTARHKTKRYVVEEL